MNPLIKSKTTIPPLLILMALVCFALSARAQAVCQEGCGLNFSTFLGEDALINNTTGFENTALGFFTLRDNTIGDLNTAVGAGALAFNTTGHHNTATGTLALLDNRTGFNNTANGSHALANTTGSGNIALGYDAGVDLTTGDNNIAIGNKGIAAEANTIRIGTEGTHTRTFVAGINGTGVTGQSVKINAAGQLGTAPSSERFKTAIKPMDNASEAIFALKPVTFHYKKDLDPEGVPQFGLVAEDVEKVNPDLLVRDAHGKAYTVRYEAVNAMLLNEFLKEHRKNEEQEATIARLQKQVQALTAGLQKVSAQVEMNRTAPQMVVNNRKD